MQPGRPGRGVTPCPKAHNYRACCRPGRAPRPDRKGRLHSRCSSPETCGRHHPHVPHPGRIRVPGRPRQGPLCPQEGLLATPTAGTHANRPASTTPRRSGGSELPAHQGCDDIFHVEPWEHKCTSADYTTTMNKYGIHWTAIGFVDGSEKLELWFRLPSWFSPSPDGLRSGCGTRSRNEAWFDCNRVQSMMSPL